MTDDSGRDLSAAFDELRAPASTANYATRTSGLDIPSTRSHWPQAMAGALAVAVALAGAGTFLALRSARQGGDTAAGATGNPPARSGAAMVYDSTSGLTLMFGGSGSTGNTLTDAWTWDGAHWTAAARGPGPITDVRMVDDPADGGVLLLGYPQLPISNSSGGVVGCASSGGGSASAGSSGSSTATPGVASGQPAIAIATAPPDISAPASAPPFAAPPTCIPTPIVAPPAVQTWLFTQHGWSRASSHATAATPPSGSQLTFDSATRQVVAVSTGYISCGYPLASASAGPAIMCPMLGAPSSAASSSAAAGPLYCAPGTTCSNGPTLQTWTWSGGSWKARPAATLQADATTVLFNDPSTDHATLMTSGYNPCVGIPINSAATLVPACPEATTPPKTSTWGWNGASWHLVSQEFIAQVGPQLGGASLTAVEGHIVLLTNAGETWTFAAGQWTLDTVAGHPSVRNGAAMAEGPSSTVVLFGGSASGFAAPVAAGTTAVTWRASVGSDTWVWNGTAWRHAGGTAPSPQPVVGCPETSSGFIPPCAPVPGKVAPSTPLSSPLPQLHVVPVSGATPTP